MLVTVYIPHPQIADVVVSAYQVSQNFSLNKKGPETHNIELKHVREMKHHTNMGTCTYIPILSSNTSSLIK